MGRSTQIYELIKNGEDQRLDFKQRVTNPHKIARTMVAFANSEGGRIVVGVDDAGEVTGVDAEQEKHVLIQAGKKYCDPPVFMRFITLEERQRTVLIAEIEPGKGEHRAVDESGEWRHYVRVRDQTVLVADADGQAEADRRNLKPIPIMLEENDGLVNYLRENEFITIKEYMKMMHISYGIAKRSLSDLVESKALGVHEVNHVQHYFLRK